MTFLLQSPTDCQINKLVVKVTTLKRVRQAEDFEEIFTKGYLICIQNTQRTLKVK